MIKRSNLDGWTSKSRWGALNLDGGTLTLDGGTLTLDGGTRTPYNLSTDYEGVGAKPSDAGRFL